MYRNSIQITSLFIISLVSVSTVSTEISIEESLSNLTELSKEYTSNLSSEETRVEADKDDAESISPPQRTDLIVTDNVTYVQANVSNTTVKCSSNCLTDNAYGTVEVVNVTRLMELLKLAAPTNQSESKNDSKSEGRTCLLVLFYARWCVFSSQAAPHFNALPRFFPRIKAVAIDASRYQNFNTQFGIVGVPTLMFIYNGKPLVKFNDTSYTLEMFARFVTTCTGLEPNGSLFVTSADFKGPLQSVPSNDTDYCLLISWFFIAACAIYFTFQSRWWQQFADLVQNTWRESNAQHEHVD